MVQVIGRAQELAALHEFLTTGRKGTTVMVLEGEAGAGKTTLWLAGVEVARTRGLRVLTARPVPAESGLPHVGLGDLFDGVLEDLLPALPPPRRSAFEVALLLADAGGRPPDIRAVGVAVLSALRWLATSAPLLVAVDDLQWLDASSTAALGFALRRLADEPVRVLLTRRVAPGQAAGGPVLSSERVDRTTIGPMSVGATHRLLLQHLGHSLPHPTLLRLHEVARGNPLFALELARALARAGGTPAPGQPLPVPASLEELVRGRIDQVRPESTQVLLAVAALAEPTLPLLGTAWPNAAEALDEAVVHGIVALDDQRIRFTHPLLASVVYEHAGLAQRRMVHRRLAELTDDPVEKARHLALGADGHDDQVADELDAAVTVARSRGAWIAAAELGELAVKATPLSRVDERSRRLVTAAGDHVAAGSSSQARRLAQEVVDSAPPGRSRAQALHVLGKLEEGGGMLSRQVQLLRTALGEAVDDLDVRAEIELSLGEALRLIEGADAAVTQARRALDLAQRSGDDALTARALATLARAKLDAGEPDAIALAESSFDRAGRAGDPESIEEALWACGYVCTFAGEVARAREAFSRCSQSVAGRDDAMESVILWLLAIVELRAGNWDLARSCAERSVELSQMLAGPESDSDPEINVTLALVLAYQSEAEQAHRLASRGLTLARASGQPFFGSWYHGILGQLEHWSGRSSRAVPHFMQAMEVRTALGFREPASPPYRVDYVEALLKLGRLDDARGVLEPWEADAIRLQRPWALAETTRSRGLLAAARGQVSEACRLLDSAAEQHALVGDPFGRARALLALGAIHRRQHQKQRARSVIEQAGTEFERLGARLWADKARAETGRIGGRTRQEGLTPAEQRVAELAARGRTNREVAATLFLSERTVESHLTHVYAKLGVRSRTELSRALR